MKRLLLLLLITLLAFSVDAQEIAPISDSLHIEESSVPGDMTIKPEYCLELVNQTHVKLHSHITDRIYYIPMYALQETLEYDNE